MNPIKLVAPDFFTGRVLNLVRALLDIGWLLVQHPSRHTLWFARLSLQIIPKYTMVLPARLLNLYRLVNQINQQGLSGDIVECGVWNGGSAAVMGMAGQTAGSRAAQRQLWLFDSFQGLPRPGERDGKAERDWFFSGWNKGDTEKVKEIFQRLNVPWQLARVVPGWFHETLPAAQIDSIAILHIDADWYDSVKVILDTLYQKVVPGGFVVLDDYGTWPGCREAVTDYLREQGISGIEIKKIDRSGAYFQKPDRQPSPNSLSQSHPESQPILTSSL